MGTRSNPFYRYQNPALGQGFTGLAAAMFPQPDKTQSEIAAREAQAAANMALSAERDQSTRGKTIRNDRYDATPNDLAQLFMSGGRFQDEPLTSNPSYQPPAPIDWNNTNLLLDGLPEQDTQPMMLGGRTATDQMAAALQQMEAYGFKPQDIMKAVGMQQYLGSAGGDNPQSGLPFLPFVGGTPTAGTALSEADQGRISARDANESLNQATTVEGMRNQNRLDIEDVREGGRGARGTNTGRTPALPTVTPRLTAEMRDSIDKRVNDMGYANVESGAIDELTRFATQLYQDPSSDTFKNSAESVFATLDMLETGQMTGVSETLRKNFFGRERRDLNRVSPGERPAPASARPDIANVPGVPAGSRIGNQSAQGWEVLDPDGNLVGHIQE